MKTLIAALFLSLSVAANALELDAASCGTNTYGSCVVYVSPAESILLRWNVNGQVSLTLSADSATDVLSANLGYSPLAGMDHVTLTNAAGESVTLTGSFGERHTCTKSGRGQHCTTFVVFLGGTVE